MTKISFSTDGYEFIISDYEAVGSKLKGMNDNKIFWNEGKYYKNHGDGLLLVTQFEITKDGKVVEKEDYQFDTNVRVAAAIVYADSVLLIHRIKNDREYYVYPGGHVKQQEDFVTAVKREIEEETNINVKTMEVELVLETNEPGFGPEKFYYVELTSQPEIYPENPESEAGSSNLEWHKISEAKSLENLFPEDLLGIVEQKKIAII